MLPDALDAEAHPLDAVDYAVYVEPSGPNMAEDGFVDGFTALLTSGAVLLLFFSVGVLFSLGAKRLGIRRPLSLLILFVSFAPSVFHVQYMRESIFRVIGASPAAKAEYLRLVVATFTATSLLYVLAIFLLGALLVWRVPWTVSLAPFVCSIIYAIFPLRPLMAALAGTDVFIDRLIHGWLGIDAVILSLGVLGWVCGSEVVNSLRYRLEHRSL